MTSGNSLPVRAMYAIFQSVSTFLKTDSHSKTPSDHLRVTLSLSERRTYWSKLVLYSRQNSPHSSSVSVGIHTTGLWPDWPNSPRDFLHPTSPLIRPWSSPHLAFAGRRNSASSLTSRSARLYLWGSVWFACSFRERMDVCLMIQVSGTSTRLCRVYQKIWMITFEMKNEIIQLLPLCDQHCNANLHLELHLLRKQLHKLTFCPIQPHTEGVYHRLLHKNHSGANASVSQNTLQSTHGLSNQVCNEHRN